MGDVLIEINLAALQGRASQKLQRLIDIVDFGRAAAPIVTADSYPVQGDFFRFHPSVNTQLTLDEARAAAEQWHVLHALREALEVASSFLEEARRCCALYAVAAPGTAVAGDLRRIESESRRFHRLGLPLKLQHLRDMYGVDSELGLHIVSLNEARNCIVHREGVVTQADAGADGRLNVSWSRLAIFARSPDSQESREIDGPSIVEAGWSIVVGARITSRSFTIGEPVTFTLAELSGMVWSNVQLVNGIAQSVQRFAEGLGFTFKKPESAV